MLPPFSDSQPHSFYRLQSFLNLILVKLTSKFSLDQSLKTGTFFLFFSKNSYRIFLTFAFRDETKLMNFFSIYGEILETQIIRDPNTNLSKGCGFVRFASMTKAEEAINHITNKAAPVRFPGVN